MDRLISYEYCERNVIPKGCRKPRDVHDLHGTATIVIREIDPALFPVAIEQRYKEQADGENDKNYHWFEGHLWEKVAERDSFAFYKTQFGGFHYTYTDVQKEITDFQAAYVLVGGIPYAQAYEPFYRVSRHRDSVFVDAYYPTNWDVFNENVFPANQPDRALAYAQKLCPVITEGASPRQLVANVHLHIRIPEALTMLNSERILERRQKLMQMQAELIADYQAEIKACQQEQQRLANAARYYSPTFETDEAAEAAEAAEANEG